MKEQGQALNQETEPVFGCPNVEYDAQDVTQLKPEFHRWSKIQRQICRESILIEGGEKVKVVGHNFSKKIKEIKNLQNRELRVNTAFTFG